MRFGVHLPQYGRAAGPDAIVAAARQAEELGFDDVWVYDHVVVPAARVGTRRRSPSSRCRHWPWRRPSPTRVGLGTSVLVLPYRHPVVLAKELASLDRLSGGRLVLGAGVGWLEAEFAALGIPFAERGARTDEAIDVLRAVWSQDPVTFHGRFVDLAEMRVLPAPARRVPIWVGGHSDAALRRAVERGDGWHGAFLAPDAVAGVTARLRAARPEPDFTLSMRLELDASTTPADEARRTLDALAAAGVQHVMAAPAQSTLPGWLGAVEALAELVAPYRAP